MTPEGDGSARELAESSAYMDRLELGLAVDGGDMDSEESSAVGWLLVADESPPFSCAEPPFWRRNIFFMRPMPSWCRR
jgi:hypothetical protein